MIIQHVALAAEDAERADRPLARRQRHTEHGMLVFNRFGVAVEEAALVGTHAVELQARCPRLDDSPHATLPNWHFGARRLELLETVRCNGRELLVGGVK